MALKIIMYLQNQCSQQKNLKFLKIAATVGNTVNCMQIAKISRRRLQLLHILVVEQQYEM